MKKHIKTVLIILSIVIAVSYTILSRSIGDLDEIWNYNLARTISEGLIPYKDISMVTTPLLPMINALFLKIFANELLTMRILAILLISSIIFLVYCLLKKLKVNESLAIIVTVSIGYLSKKYFCIDYNFFVLLLTLIILCFEIDIKKSTFKKDFIIGFLAGLAIITKQTTGILITFAIIGYKIVFLMYNSLKNKRTGTSEFT